jgi:hypothetical protein
MIQDTMKYSYTVNGEERSVVVLGDGSVLRCGSSETWASVADWREEVPTGTVLTRSVDICGVEMGRRRLRMWIVMGLFVPLAFVLR